MQDPTGQTRTAVETINVPPPQINAVPHSYQTRYGVAVTGNSAANDTYAPLSVFTVKSQPVHGTVVMGTNGTFTYTPAAGYSGTDTFVYQIRDPAGQIVTAVETITIAPQPAALQCLTSFSKLKF